MKIKCKCANCGRSYEIEIADYVDGIYIKDPCPNCNPYMTADDFIYRRPNDTKYN